MNMVGELTINGLQAKNIEKNLEKKMQENYQRLKSLRARNTQYLEDTFEKLKKIDPKTDRPRGEADQFSEVSQISK